jgi:hypothetical protein
MLGPPLLFRLRPPGDDAPIQSSRNNQQWIEFWQSIATFTGLRSLRVEIRAYDHLRNDWEMRRADVLEGIDLVVSGVFGIILPRRSDYWNLPCGISSFDISGGI